MTHKNSICIRCANLDSYEGFVISKSGDVSLISECYYGGKNAGDRKTCKRFRAAKEDTVRHRMKLFEMLERRADHADNHNGS